MKGIFGRIASPSVNRANAGVPSYGMIPPLGSVPSASGAMISQATAMTVSTVYACVNRLATDISRCTPSLYSLNDDGSREQIVNHPVCDVFRRPNEQQTWFEFSWQMWVAHYLRGNAYAAIKRDRRGNPIELIPINPDAVMVLESSDGQIFYNVNRIGLWQIAMLRDFPVAIPEDDILHIRGLSFNALVGVSTIGLARDAIGLSMGLEQQASRWIGNGARPATWLKSPKTLSDAAASRLKKQFDEMHAGYQNTGKTVVLEEGIEPVELQLTSVDLEFMAQRNMQVLEVCRFFGVPPHKVGVAADSRGASQNLAAQDQDYINTSVSQKLVLAEQRFQRVFGLDAENIYVDLDETQLLRADVLTRRNAARLGILSGITTQNEERRAEGLPPKSGADVLLTPQNMAAQGSNITGQAPDGAGRPDSGTISDGNAGTGGTQGSPQDGGDPNYDAAPQN